MSETVEDVLEREGGWDDTVRVLEDMDGGWLLDALIGCQGRVVYTAEDVERAAKALADAESMRECGKPRLPGAYVFFLDDARAALTAAGGVVVDEVWRDFTVVEAGIKGPDGQYVPLPDVLDDGDKLYIERAEEE